MRRNPALRVTCWLALLLGALTIQSHASERSADQDAYFDRLKGLCGARFEGAAVFPEDPGDDWRDQLLVARFQDCAADELRVPFLVGDDASRTWIIRRLPEGLQLKHDHRHADGTPDEVTDYGGMTAQAGSMNSQSFKADAHTAKLIPEAATNEWFLSLDEEGTVLTYYLERHGAPRFKAVLRRVP